MEQTTLELILNKQKEFQSKFGYNEKADLKTICSLVHSHSAFVVEEVYEMLREMPFHKPWVDYSNLTDVELSEKMEKSKKEFLDVFIFMSNIAVFLNLDEATIREMYLEKNKLNIQRQEDPELGYIQEKK